MFRRNAWSIVFDNDVDDAFILKTLNTYDTIGTFLFEGLDSIRQDIEPYLVDLLAIAPFYVAPLAAHNTVVFRLLRIFRLLRLLKLGRYHSSLGLLGKVLKNRREELVISLALVAMLVVVASTLMYALEHEAQPKAFSSIPAAMWWGVVTMTTVGYGDVYPVTTAGKVVAGLSLLLGVGLFALPAGILASGFSEELQREREEEKAQAVCPHCGKPLDQHG